MKFDNDLSAVHAYLCGDGYVIKNPLTQKHKYYRIGLRNTNQVLLKDFQVRFFRYFGLKPYIVEGRCSIGSKEIYKILTEDYSYYSWEWRMPKLSNSNLKFWLRAFFDCKSWVELQKAKSRSIRLECVNKSGLFSVAKALRIFNIDSSIKFKNGRNIWRLNICGLDDIKRFSDCIGFLHPNKKRMLIKALNSYSEKHKKLYKSSKFYKFYG